MTARKALWTQGGTTSAEEDRAALRALLHDQGGVMKATDLAVTQNGTPNMTVNVAAGRCAIPGTESASLQGTYVGWLDATLSVVISAADATNPRIDLIVAKVQDAQYSGASNLFSVVAVTGTPAGSPVPPAAPANSIILAQVAVAALAASIVTANITDKRAPAGVRLPTVASTALYQASPVDGQVVYRGSGDANEGPEFYNGAAWRKAWSMPWGPVAPTAQATAAQSGFTTVVDATSLSITFTAIANRRYRVTVTGNVQSSVAADAIAVSLTDSANAVLTFRQPTVSGANLQTPVQFTHDTTTPSVAGSYTFKLRLTRATGTGTCTTICSATQPFQITVDDIGPASGTPS